MDSATGVEGTLFFIFAASLEKIRGLKDNWVTTKRAIN
jgi:hypothetical protein